MLVRVQLEIFLLRQSRLVVAVVFVHARKACFSALLGQVKSVRMLFSRNETFTVTVIVRNTARNLLLIKSVL